MNKEEQLNKLYEEYYEACFNVGFYKAKADKLEKEIQKLKDEDCNKVITLTCNTERVVLLSEFEHLKEIYKEIYVYRQWRNDKKGDLVKEFVGVLKS